MADFIISAGTVSVTNGETTVDGNITNFKTAGIAQGDEIVVDGLVSYVDNVISDTELELTVGFPGSTGSGKSYQIFKQRQAALAAENNYRLREILEILAAQSSLLVPVTQEEWNSLTPTVGVFYFIIEEEG